MKSLYSKISLLLVLVSVQTMAESKQSSISEITRTYDLSEMERVELDNQFGRIIITATDQKVLSLTAKIKISANSEGQAEELLDRFSLVDDAFSNRLQIKAVLEEESSIWQSFFQKISREVKGTKIQVDYHISMPVDIPLELSNRYGEVVIPSWTAECWLDISHGDLSAGSFVELNGILRASDFIIEHVEEGNLTLKNSEGEIESVNKLEIESSFSDVEISEAKSLELNSKNDRFDIARVGKLEVDAIFSKMKVEHLQESGIFDLNFGYLQIEKLSPKFDKLDCNTKMGDFRVYVNPDQAVYFNVEAMEKNLDFDFSQWGAQMKYIDENEKIVRVKSLSENKDLPSIIVRAERGNIDIWKF